MQQQYAAPPTPSSSAGFQQQDYIPSQQPYQVTESCDKTKMQTKPNKIINATQCLVWQKSHENGMKRSKTKNMFDHNQIIRTRANSESPYRVGKLLEYYLIQHSYDK